MRKIIVMPGDHINHVVARLVANAPACADFNGVPIRARYATTRPGDVVRQYEHVSALRSIAWQHSSEGLRVAAERAARAAEAQRIVDWHLEMLPSLPWDDTAAVLTWVEGIADAADHVDVQYNHAAVVSQFMVWDWHPGANCGAEFNVYDARNFAGWIVGQWLASRYPNVSMFAAQWRERFPHECANRIGTTGVLDWTN